MSQEKDVTCLTQDFVGPCNKQANIEEAVIYPMGVVGPLQWKGYVLGALSPEDKN